jgi:hypothetical protein
MNTFNIDDDRPVFPLHRYDGWGRRYISVSDGQFQYMLCSELNSIRVQNLRQASMSTPPTTNGIPLSPLMITFLVEFAITRNLCWPKRVQKSEDGWYCDIPADKEIVTSQQLEDHFVRYMLENIISVKREGGDEDEVVEMREAYEMIRKIFPRDEVDVASTPRPSDTS